MRISHFVMLSRWHMLALGFAQHQRNHMTRKHLICRVLGWIVFAFVYSALRVAVNAACPDAFLSTALEGLSPVMLLVAAAFLARDFNRRNSHLGAVRQSYLHMVPAVQEAIQYTHLRKPTQRDFACAQALLSTAIDSPRMVYENIDATDGARGLYPFDELKSIRKEIDDLRFGRVLDRATARRRIINHWRDLHDKIAGDLDRVKPPRAWRELRTSAARSAGMASCADG